MSVNHGKNNLFHSVWVVHDHMFHFTNSCMVLDGCMNINGILFLLEYLFFNGIYLRADAHKHIKIWRERCSMSDSKFNINFGSKSYVADDGTPYDFGSVMHYSPWACANSSLPVITKPDGSPITLTKTETFSEWDIKQINYIYNCKLVSSSITSLNDFILIFKAN